MYDSGLHLNDALLMTASILFVHNHLTRFVKIDRDLLQARWPVQEWYERRRWVNLYALAQAVRRSALVFGWFASWHTFWPVLFARWLRKPAVLIIGGYDVASLAPIGYGHQRGGLPQQVSRVVMHLATQLITNSHFSQAEAVRHIGLAPQQIQVIYHGLADPFSAQSTGCKAGPPLALTVGNVEYSNLWRKGHLLFVHAAAQLPAWQFVLVGAWRDNAIAQLKAVATPNVSFVGEAPDAVLFDYYQKASVYVQASAHEGFGLSVAEAMLAQCIPVVTTAGALPEVVGDTGVYITPEACALAAGIQQAHTVRCDTRHAARQRVLTHFPLEARSAALRACLEKILSHAPCA